MSKEYKIIFDMPNPYNYAKFLITLPSPIKKPEYQEIYNYSIDDYGFYFIDWLVDKKTFSYAFKLFVDEALSHSQSVKIEKL